MARTVLAVLAAAAATSALTVEMRERAEVASSYIRLADVATLADATEDERARLADLFLGRAPRDGQEVTVRRDDVLLELRKQGVAADGVRFLGAEAARVTRAEASAETPAGAFQAKLVRAVQLFLRRQPSFQGAEAEVRIVGPVDVPVGDGKVVEAVPDRTPGPGVDWWEATWRPAQGAEVRIPFQARVVAYLTVVVAKRAISMNAAVGPDDVDLARVSADAGREYYTSTADVLGLHVSRTVAKGAPIDPSCLKAVVLVKARDAVLCRVTGGAYVIEFYAEAQQEGGMGEAIRVRNLTSGRVFVARVTGRGRVEPVGVGEGGNR